MKISDLFEEQLDYTEVEKVLAKLGINSRNTDKDAKAITLTVQYATQKQLDALDKCSRYDWKITKILYTKFGDRKAAFALTAKDMTAWLLPDGTLERAKIGQKNAKLRDSDWLERII